MAANMQQMAAQGGMMPQQRQQQNTMQMNEYLLAAVKNHHDQNTWMGWQSQFDPKERVLKIYPLVSNMALAGSPSLDWIKAAEHTLAFERELFVKAPDRQTYEAQIHSKTQQFLRKRQENVGALQNSVHAQAQQQQQQQQQFMMNQAMQQNRMNQNMGQNPQQSLQHLQFQMQASHLPQQQQMGMNMAGNGGPPVGPNQQMFQMANGQQRPPSMMDGATAMGALDQNKVMELAQRLASQTPPAQKDALRNQVRNKYPERAAEFENTGKDPVMIYFHHNAIQTLRKNAAAGRQAAGMVPNGNPRAFGGHPMMQGGRGHMNPNMLTPGALQQAAASGGDFGSQFNMENIVNQQKAGILAQQEGQMVVPASNAGGANRNPTPQPNGMQGQQAMPNQPGPNQTPRPPQAQQQFNMQQVQQQAQQQQAHLRAQQQIRQLQGQQNGLGGGMPNSQSPGLNTLNTPMRRPPSAMNAAEGQGPTQQPNAPFPGGLDPRFNQGNQRQLPPSLTNNQMFQTMLAQMTPEQRQQISMTPADKLHEVMSRWQENQRQLQIKAMAQAGNGMQQVPIGPVQGQQPGQYNAANLGNPMQMQTPMMQPGQGPGNLTSQSQMILAQQQQMLQRVRQQPQASLPPQPMQMMDAMDIPLPMLMSMQQQIHVPPEIRKWKQLKVWADANLPPQTREQLLAAQKKHWLNLASKNFEQRKQMQQQPQQGGMGQQQVQTPGPLAQQMQMQMQGQQMQGQQMQGQQMPGGMQQGAAPNQMAQQQRPGMPPNMANISQLYQQITPQQIQAARASSEKLAGATDDQIRNLIMQSMHKQHQKMQGGPQQMPARQQQPNPQQMNPVTMPQQVTPVNLPQQAIIQPPAPTPKAPTPQMTPAQAAAGNKPGAPEPKATNSNARGGANNRGGPSKAQAQAGSPATARKNLKRPSPDDAADSTANNSQQSQPQQASQDARPQIPGRFAQLTPEQLAQMPPEQRARYEQLKRAHEQQAADMERLKQIGQEEQRNSRNEVMAEVAMSNQERALMGGKLQKLKADMGKIGRVLGKWYGSTRDDGRARDYFRTRLRLMHQYKDGEQMSQFKDRFTLRISDLDEASKLLQSMVIDCAAMSKQHPGAKPGAQPAPLSAANLEKQTQALNKAQHNRTASKGGQQPPAAPTTTQPPFPFGATSPHGQPSYAGKPMVSRDNLNLPPRKKAKVGEHPTPPQAAQATPSPQISKTSSPEVKMKPQPAKPTFKCPDPDCEMASTGFSTDAALKAHIQEDHVKPLEDPVKFMQENLAAALGLDAGSLEKLQAEQAVKQGQTPASNPATTPVSRVASIQQNKGGSKGTRGGDVQAQSNGAAGAAEPWPNTIDPSLFTRLGSFEFGAGGAITDMKAWRALTPNDTPESMKDSGTSEPNSDIPENAGLDIDINWQSVEADLLVDMNNVSMDGLQDLQGNGTSFNPSPMDDSTSAIPSGGINWDDVHIDFDKPFVMDMSLYSLDVS